MSATHDERFDEQVADLAVLASRAGHYVTAIVVTNEPARTIITPAGPVEVGARICPRCLRVECGPACARRRVLEQAADPGGEAVAATDDPRLELGTIAEAVSLEGTILGLDGHEPSIAAGLAQVFAAYRAIRAERDDLKRAARAEPLPPADPAALLRAAIARWAPRTCSPDGLLQLAQALEAVEAVRRAEGLAESAEVTRLRSAVSAAIAVIADAPADERYPARGLLHRILAALDTAEAPSDG